MTNHRICADCGHLDEDHSDGYCTKAADGQCLCLAFEPPLRDTSRKAHTNRTAQMAEQDPRTESAAALHNPTTGEELSNHYRAGFAAILKLHRPVGIYDECECTDEQKEVGHEDIYEVGLTCNKLYTICGECCRDDIYQTEDCANNHPHNHCYPCPTAIIAETVLHDAG